MEAIKDGICSFLAAYHLSFARGTKENSLLLRRFIFKPGHAQDNCVWPERLSTRFCQSPP